MTEKRFTLIECNGNIEDGYTQIVYDGGEDVFELLDLLNELYEENNEEELDYFKSKCGSLEEKLFYINRENEQLKQRNDRQTKQLDRLYHLVENKDWRTLTDIMDDFKKAEEQLQREWRTYE